MEKGRWPLVAIKELKSSDKKEFNKEATILRTLGPKNHPHLIELLATFQLNDKYHLIFPYADANLQNYWSKHDTHRNLSSIDTAVAKWCLEQCSGLVSALNLVHNFKVTGKLLDGEGIAPQKDGMLRVQHGEAMYGRHGDIKPGNILWFEHRPGQQYCYGALKLADFGLGRFHGRDSRSGDKDVHASPTYEPPECKLHKAISRAYDIWSLGCVFLEFITWLLKGSDEIDNFATARGERALSTDIDGDEFFTVIGKHAEIRKGVLSWVKGLHQDPKCSTFIHDFLDLIMERILVIEPNDRIKAARLKEALEEFKLKAENEGYLENPCPRTTTSVLPALSSRPTAMEHGRALIYDIQDRRTYLPLEVASLQRVSWLTNVGSPTSFRSATC